MQVRVSGNTITKWLFLLNFSSLLVVIFPAAQYFQIMPNFEDFQQLKSWKRQGASAPRKFYKSNKENISCPIAVYSRKLWKSKTNFEHWKFMKNHHRTQREELSQNLLLETRCWDEENCLVLLIVEMNLWYAAILDSSIEIKAWTSHSQLFTTPEHKR